MVLTPFLAGAMPLLAMANASPAGCIDTQAMSCIGSSAHRLLMDAFPLVGIAIGASHPDRTTR